MLSRLVPYKPKLKLSTTRPKSNADSIVTRRLTYAPGLVIGGGLVTVQFFGTFGLFSKEAIGLRGSKSKLL